MLRRLRYGILALLVTAAVPAITDSLKKDGPELMHTLHQEVKDEFGQTPDLRIKKTINVPPVQLEEVRDTTIIIEDTKLFSRKTYIIKIESE